MTVHSFARGKLPRQNMMNDVRLFSRVLVLGNSMRINNNRHKCALPTWGMAAFVLRRCCYKRQLQIHDRCCHCCRLILP